MLLPIIEVPTSNRVVEPSVVVRVDDPVLIVETIAEVVNAEVESWVSVEEYVRYWPVGVGATLPDKVIILPLDVELES